jgi:hypothetical protein
MSNGKTPNGTKCRMKKRRMGQNVEWKYGKKNMCLFFFGFLLLRSDYMGRKSKEMCICKIILLFEKKTIGHYMYSNVEKIVENVENVRGNVCI